MMIVTGNVRGYQLYDQLDRPGTTFWRSATSWISNTHMCDMAVAAASLFRNLQDGKNYYVGAMYFEFDNSGSVVDPVPTIDIKDGVDYYLGLTGTKDFLRSPITATSGSNSDTSKFLRGNNVAYFSARTEGTTGLRSSSPLTFSDVNNSRVIGGALVAQRSPTDTTQDFVIARFYFDSPVTDQIEKVAGNQIGLDWPLTFDWS